MIYSCRPNFKTNTYLEWNFIYYTFVLYVYIWFDCFLLDMIILLLMYSILSNNLQ